MKIEKEREIAVPIKNLDYGDAFVFEKGSEDFEYNDETDVCIKVSVPKPIVYAHDQSELKPANGWNTELFYYVHSEDGTFYWTQNTCVIPRTVKAVISALEK